MGLSDKQLVRDDFLFVIRPALHLSFTEDILNKAIEMSGMIPFNPDRVLNQMKHDPECPYADYAAYKKERQRYEKEKREAEEKKSKGDSSSANITYHTTRSSVMRSPGHMIWSRCCKMPV